MTEDKRVLVLDAGNTTLKLGLFSDGILVKTFRVAYSDEKALEDLFNLYRDTQIVLSSVISKQETEKIADRFRNCFIVDQQTPLPIQLKYKTPGTLGIDRICNAVAVSAGASGRKGVAIDIGTCIKFDLIDEKKVYQGGSISPGIHLRYRSLNDHTANLPLLELTTSAGLTGKSTTESIHSGVMNGMKAEIEGLIQRYSDEYGDLTFFVTGGDTAFFDLEGKNNIFADENLTLKGLYLIYQFNAH
jgi:type III pantothenate kinase